MRVGDVTIGAGQPLVLIAGPCVLESRDHALRLAEQLAGLCRARALPLVFKASFDKANRSRHDSPRGPGLEAGIAWLAHAGREAGVPTTTDVHTPEQAAAVAAAIDLLQVPAFLCRQTDLLQACAATGRPVNVKKGQFCAAEDMRHALDKLAAAGDGGALLTERGTTFGYGDLVADMRNIPRMQALGAPVVFDGTHSVQRPGGASGQSGGDRALAPVLISAAIAAGCDAIFAEVHDDPPRAWSDAATQLPLDQFEAMLDQWLRVAYAVNRA